MVSLGFQWFQMVLIICASFQRALSSPQRPLIGLFVPPEIFRRGFLGLGRPVGVVIGVLVALEVVLRALQGCHRGFGGPGDCNLLLPEASEPLICPHLCPRGPHRHSSGPQNRVICLHLGPRGPSPGPQRAFISLHWGPRNSNRILERSGETLIRIVWEL